MGLPSGNPPSFFDRAYGVGGLGGTATPTDALLIAQQSTDPSFEEIPESPQIEFAEQGTFRHVFITTYGEALLMSLGLKRGIILEDSFGNVSKILSTSVNSRRGGMAELIVVAESLMTVDLPPQEFAIEPIEFNPAIEKHPRYFIYDATAVTTPYVILTPFDLYLVRNSVQAADFFGQASFESLLSSNIPPGDPYTSQTTDDKRQAARIELASKMLIGIENPYIPAFRVTFSEFFFYGSTQLGSGNVNPNLNPGGYIEDPTTQIPPQFWSVDGSGDTATNILLPIPLGGAMFTTNSPSFYASGISWLREADSIFFQRTWFKITSTWIGGPVGQWDAQLYSSAPSPYLP